MCQASPRQTSFDTLFASAPATEAGSFPRPAEGAEHRGVRAIHRRFQRASVVECASPLALSTRQAKPSQSAPDSSGAQSNTWRSKGDSWGGRASESWTRLEAMNQPGAGPRFGLRWQTGCATALWLGRPAWVQWAKAASRVRACRRSPRRCWASEGSWKAGGGAIGGCLMSAATRRCTLAAAWPWRIRGGRGPSAFWQTVWVLTYGVPCDAAPGFPTDVRRC